VLPARSVFIAAGTQPNTVLAREDPAFQLDGKYFRRSTRTVRPVAPSTRTAKPERRCCCRAWPTGAAVSFFGDLHPSYFGNVVKAMGSAKQGYPVVSRVLARQRTSQRRRRERFSDPA
jgi:hypothetical protein